MQEQIIEAVNNYEELLESKFMFDFGVNVHFLEEGFFSSSLLKRQQEGADLAHIKLPHIGGVNNQLLEELNEMSLKPTQVTKTNKSM
jgi:hypothetical protein